MPCSCTGSRPPATRATLASIAVLRKVGMRHEGRLRENVRLRDGWRDSEVFGVLAHEWVPSEGGITLQ